MSKIRLAFVPRPRRGETENMYTLLQTKYTLKRFCLYYYSFRRREPSFVDLFFYVLKHCLIVDLAQKQKICREQVLLASRSPSAALKLKYKMFS